MDMKDMERLGVLEAAQMLGWIRNGYGLVLELAPALVNIRSDILMLARLDEG